MSDSSQITPDMIERMRQTGIRLDREGRLWHEGAEITHPRLRRALLSWIDVRKSDGRPILRFDDKRYAYIDVDDAHLLVQSIRWEGERAFALMNDGSEEELDYDSLRVSPEDDALYCRVRGGRLEARITTRAYHVLTRAIEQREDGSFALRAAGDSFPIGTRERDR